MSVLSVFGVDIAKSGFVVCQAVTATPPRSWPTTPISYANPHWFQDFTALLRSEPAEPPVVVLEPTGFHYSYPIIQIARAAGATVYQSPHAITGHVRQTHVATAKTDNMDARALCLIALWVDEGNPPRGVRAYAPDRAAAVAELRLLVNRYRTLTKQSTRYQNQLDQLAHAICPQLALNRDTWLHAAWVAEAVTPAELRALAAQPRPEGYTPQGFGYLKKLAAKLDAAYPEPDPILRRAVLDTTFQLRQLDRQLDALTTTIEARIFLPPLDGVSQRWSTVAGYSPLRIAALHVATHGSADLMSVDEFKAALATAPRANASGTTEGARGTKSGYRPAKAEIHLWAQFLVGPNSPDNAVKRYYQSTTSSRAFAAAKNKLARILHGIAVNPQGSWEDAR